MQRGPKATQDTIDIYSLDLSKIRNPGLSLPDNQSPQKVLRTVSSNALIMNLQSTKDDKNHLEWAIFFYFKKSSFYSFSDGAESVCLIGPISL